MSFTDLRCLRQFLVLVKEVINAVIHFVLCVCTKKPRLNSVSACLPVARLMRVRLVLAVQGRVNTDNMSASWLSMVLECLESGFYSKPCIFHCITYNLFVIREWVAWLSRLLRYPLLYQSISSQDKRGCKH